MSASMDPDLLQKSQEEALREEERRKTTVPAPKTKWKVCPEDGHRLPCAEVGLYHPTYTERRMGCLC